MKRRLNAPKRLSIFVLNVTLFGKKTMMSLKQLRSCIHKRLSKVWKWEILTIASAEEREIS